MGALDFYAEVRILPSEATKALGVDGAVGVVLGISHGVRGDIYAVSVQDETYMINSSDAAPTGRKFSRDDFYDGTSIEVPPERYSDDDPSGK